MADTVEMQETLVAGCTRITHVSLHVASPGATGANEVAGGTPAYARLPITWGATPPGDGSRVGTPQGIFNLPPNTNVTHLGFWDGDTYLDSTPMLVSSVSQDELEVGQVVYRVVNVVEVGP